MTDVFLTALNSRGHLSNTKSDSSNSVVLDVGSNAGFFSTVAASLGYDVHSIDVQPFCSMHVLTQGKENGISDRIHPYNVGLSSSPGEKIQIPYISCKGGLGFEVNEADTERKKRHAHALVPLMRLDEFVAENIGTKPIKLMKMDTEG